jgi:hypothetical protein
MRFRVTAIPIYVNISYKKYTCLCCADLGASEARAALAAADVDFAHVGYHSRDLVAALHLLELVVAERRDLHGRGAVRVDAAENLCSCACVCLLCTLSSTSNVFANLNQAQTHQVRISLRCTKRRKESWGKRSRRACALTPSCPLRPLPHVRRSPNWLIAAVCALPHETDTICLKPRNETCQ